MSRTIKVGIIGAGWPGQSHAKAYMLAGGFEIKAVADLIPERRKAMLDEFKEAREFAQADEMLTDPQIDAVSVCLPTHLHADTVVTALKAGKHVLCETPPSLEPKQVGQMGRAAEKAGKVLLFGLQRRFGLHEQAARVAAGKGFLGEIYQIRATWMRTRAIPIGTGWYTNRAEAGGGAMADLGLQMLDLAWAIMGEAKPLSVYATCQRRLGAGIVAPRAFDVDEATTALLRFEGDKVIELGASWAINQPPQQQGTVCRICGTQGAMEVYTPAGAVLYRDFTPDGECKPIELKGPKVIGHHAMMKHFKDCIAGKSKPQIGAERAGTLMEILQAIYKSHETGKSVSLA